MVITFSATASLRHILVMSDSMMGLTVVLACQTALRCMMSHSASETACKTDTEGLKEQSHKMHACYMVAC